MSKHISLVSFTITVEHDQPTLSYKDVSEALENLVSSGEHEDLEWTRFSTEEIEEEDDDE